MPHDTPQDNELPDSDIIAGFEALLNTMSPAQAERILPWLKAKAFPRDTSRMGLNVLAAAAISPPAKPSDGTYEPLSSSGKPSAQPASPSALAQLAEFQETHRLLARVMTEGRERPEPRIPSTFSEEWKRQLADLEVWQQQRAAMKAEKGFSSSDEKGFSKGAHDPYEALRKIPPESIVNLAKIGGVFSPKYARQLSEIKAEVTGAK